MLREKRTKMALKRHFQVDCSKFQQRRLKMNVGLLMTVGNLEREDYWMMTNVDIVGLEEMRLAAERSDMRVIDH